MEVLSVRTHAIITVIIVILTFLVSIFKEI